MMGFSGEHLLILGVIFLFFGPKRLPELGSAVGKTLHSLRAGLSGQDLTDASKQQGAPVLAKVESSTENSKA